MGRVLAVAAALLWGGLLYAWVLIPLGLRLPCPFRLLTGLKCPGCGITDLCLALLEGDLSAAFFHNRAVFLALPPLFLLLGLGAADYVRPLPPPLVRGKNLLTALLLCALLVWGAGRNLWGV